MAVLQLEDGRRFVDPDTIGELIAPTLLTRVPVPAGIDDLLALPSLDEAQTERFLAACDPGLDDQRRQAGWPPPLAQVFWPGMPDELEQRLAGYGPPHTNPVDEVHHVVDGAVEFGLVLPDGTQARVLVQPGEALTLHEGTVHWSTLTADHRVKAYVLLSKPPGYAHAYTDTPIRVP